MALKRLQTLLWLVGAGLLGGGGCGSRSSTDLEGAFGAPNDSIDGGLGGAPGACAGPGCQGCATCLDACVCASGDRGYCTTACGQQAGCTAPACDRCDTCLDECTCVTGDVRGCLRECGGPVPTGGAPPTGGQGGVGGDGVRFCGDGLYCAPSPRIGDFQLGACCRSPFECGLDGSVLGAGASGSCLERFAPGSFDPSCESLPGPAGVWFDGCCTQQGVCGLDMSAFELGCVQNGVATPLEPRPCGYNYGYGGYGYGGYGYGGYGYYEYPGGSYGYGGYYGGPGGSYGYGGYYGYGGSGGSAVVAQCVAAARSECEVCSCTACLGEVTACFGDVGCPSILQCANATGCSGADCYDPATCQAVIDNFGGLSSPSTSLAVPLFLCLQSAGCPCGFATP